jgi:hypothetical protein
VAYKPWKQALEVLKHRNVTIPVFIARLVDVTGRDAGYS